jgi:nitroreductase
MAELLSAIGGRFACRQYRNTPVADEELNLVLEAGRIAPSAVGMEPWRFIVVQSDAAKEKVAAACFDQPAATTAPLMIAIVALVGVLAPGTAYVEARLAAEAGGNPPPEALREVWRALYAEHDPQPWALGQCNFAAAQMMLQATSMGLATCPMGGFDEAALTQALDLPKGEVPALVLALGHGAEAQGERRRRGMGEVVTVI